MVRNSKSFARPFVNRIRPKKIRNAASPRASGNGSTGAECAVMPSSSLPDSHKTGARSRIAAGRRGLAEAGEGVREPRLRALLGDGERVGERVDVAQRAQLRPPQAECRQ